jgi:hypothetical protein
MASRSKQKDQNDLELEEALCLSTNDVQEECEEQERRFTEAIQALIGEGDAKG